MDDQIAQSVAVTATMICMISTPTTKLDISAFDVFIHPG
ncbi:hypothetical protein SynTAK9802_00888 [Synechococcus sp. TAK9802]|nr:hypothetical protein SynTAK9802_00888 [Synechococcus sp. TAK9802]